MYSAILPAFNMFGSMLAFFAQKLPNEAQMVTYRYVVRWRAESNGCEALTYLT